GRVSMPQQGENSFGSINGGYGPGWRRMAARRDRPADDGWKPTGHAGGFSVGERVFHQKFGMGNILTINGDKLLIAFDKAGQKHVVSGFVSKP
ncbi:MAG: DNA helicase II, partial [Candidatus Puniceispirillum sp.]